MALPPRKVMATEKCYSWGHPVKEEETEKPLTNRDFAGTMRAF